MNKAFVIFNRFMAIAAIGLFSGGSVYAMNEATENPVTIVIATEPPCGVDVAGEGPALFPMPRNGQWGYVTRDGQWAIEPQWDYAESFSEGRAAVNDLGRWGIIDRAGAYVLEPVLRSSTGGTPLQPFSQGCSTANIQKDGNPHPFFVDRAGRFWLDDALPADLNGRDIWDFGNFSEGRVWFQAMGEGLKESYGWIDSQGNVILKDEFSGAGEFVEGKAPAASGGDYWAFIDSGGNPVLPNKWKFGGARPFSEGLAAVEVKSYQWMYFSAEGVIAVEKVTLNPVRQVLGKSMQEAKIKSAGDFHDGLAPILPAMMFDAEELIYIRPDGSEAFAPASLLQVEVCQPYRLPEFHDGLLQLLVAGEGAECADATPARILPKGSTAHYIYLDTSGNIVLQQADTE